MDMIQTEFHSCVACFSSFLIFSLSFHSFTVGHHQMDQTPWVHYSHSPCLPHSHINSMTVPLDLQILLATNNLLLSQYPLL